VEGRRVPYRYRGRRNRVASKNTGRAVIPERKTMDARARVRTESLYGERDFENDRRRTIPEVRSVAAKSTTITEIVFRYRNCWSSASIRTANRRNGRPINRTADKSYPRKHGRRRHHQHDRARRSTNYFVPVRAVPNRKSRDPDGRVRCHRPRVKELVRDAYFPFD